MEHDPDFHNPWNRRRKKREGGGGHGRRPAHQAWVISKEAGPMRLARLYFLHDEWIHGACSVFCCFSCLDVFSTDLLLLCLLWHLFPSIIHPDAVTECVWVKDIMWEREKEKEREGDIRAFHKPPALWHHRDTQLEREMLNSPVSTPNYPCSLHSMWSITVHTHTHTQPFKE